MNFVYAVVGIVLVIVGFFGACEAVARAMWGVFFVSLIIVALGAMGLIAMVTGML